MKRALFCGVAAIAVAAFLVATPARLSAQSVPIDGKSISGVVKSPHGAEAGVWVIAETNDLRHPVCQDGGDRRSGPLRAAGPAEGQI